MLWGDGVKCRSLIQCRIRKEASVILFLHVNQFEHAWRINILSWIDNFFVIFNFFNLDVFKVGAFCGLLHSVWWCLFSSGRFTMVTISEVNYFLNREIILSHFTLFSPFCKWLLLNKWISLVSFCTHIELKLHGAQGLLHSDLLCGLIMRKVIYSKFLLLQILDDVVCLDVFIKVSLTKADFNVRVLSAQII